MTGQGRFITFEGGEGAGKSTQIRRLADALQAAGQTVVVTREPGGSQGAEAIRRLLVEGAADRWDGLTETLLHYACRRDHLRAVIRPALARGEWVLCDRYQDSTVAYQGYGHGMASETLDMLYQAVGQGLWPNLTLILDLPEEIGLARAGRRGGDENRYESMDPGFHRRLREGYLSIARLSPDRCRVIDATQGIDHVTAAVFAQVNAAFGLDLVTLGTAS
jgi:dTMP kinase